MGKIKVPANTQGKQCDEKESLKAWRGGAKVENSLHAHKDPNLDPCTHANGFWCMACNPSTVETATEGSLGLADC